MLGYSAYSFRMRMKTTYISDNKLFKIAKSKNSFLYKFLTFTKHCFIFRRKHIVINREIKSRKNRGTDQGSLNS